MRFVFIQPDCPVCDIGILEPESNKMTINSGDRLICNLCFRVFVARNVCVDINFEVMESEDGEVVIDPFTEYLYREGVSSTTH